LRQRRDNNENLRDANAQRRQIDIDIVLIAAAHIEMQKLGVSGQRRLGHALAHRTQTVKEHYSVENS
jgi:7,8-dihydro-6-hydroxymethylpterin-pyrophosphokinase